MLVLNERSKHSPILKEFVETKTAEEFSAFVSMLYKEKIDGAIDYFYDTGEVVLRLDDRCGFTAQKVDIALRKLQFQEPSVLILNLKDILPKEWECVIGEIEKINKEHENRYTDLEVEPTSSIDIEEFKEDSPAQSIHKHNTKGAIKASEAFGKTKASSLLEDDLNIPEDLK
jgi:hypothetical protein